MPTEASVKKLTDLFNSQVVYRIPPFQRRYAWNKERQWKPLWDDIKSVADRLIAEQEQVHPHFMGAIILQKTDNPNEILVIDGQQRLTTLQLIIRETHRAFPTYPPQRDLQRLMWNDDGHLKIECQREDHDVFQRVMTYDLENDQQTNPIWSAAKYFHEAIRQWTTHDNVDDGPNGLSHLKTIICEFLDVVVITLGTEEQPNTIFETLNSRAEGLSQSDLVRNTIMYEALKANSLDEVRGQWAYLETEWWRRVGGDARAKLRHVDMLLHCWVAIRKRSFGDKTRVAARFRDIIAHGPGGHNDNGTPILSIVEELVRIGEIYRTMETNGPSELKILRGLNRGYVMIPFFLRIYDLVTDVEVRNCIVSALESYLVRYFLLRQHFHFPDLNLNPNLFLRLIQPIEDNMDAPLAPFRETLRNLVNEFPDPILRHFLPFIRIPGAKKDRKMILETIEGQMGGGNQPDNLEYHEIMPRAWRDHPAAWGIPGELDDVEQNEIAIARDQALHRIGNITLVEVGLFDNADLAGSWDTKRLRFSDSTVGINQGLGEKEGWDIEQIRARSTMFAEYIVNTWPIP